MHQRRTPAQRQLVAGHSSTLVARGRAYRQTITRHCRGSAYRAVRQTTVTHEHLRRRRLLRVPRTSIRPVFKPHLRRVVGGHRTDAEIDRRLRLTSLIIRVVQVLIVQIQPGHRVRVTLHVDRSAATGEAGVVHMRSRPYVRLEGDATRSVIHRDATAAAATRAVRVRIATTGIQAT